MLLNVLKYKPFLIKPNHHELGDIFGVEVKSEYEIAHYARKLQEMGARNVLVSRSKDGATLIDENGEVLPAIQILTITNMHLSLARLAAMQQRFAQALQIKLRLI